MPNPSIAITSGIMSTNLDRVPEPGRNGDVLAGCSAQEDTSVYTLDSEHGSFQEATFGAGGITGWMLVRIDSSIVGWMAATRLMLECTWISMMILYQQMFCFQRQQFRSM